MYYKLYFTDNKKRSRVKGLWLDRGKFIFDNIYIKRYSNKKDLQGQVKGLFDRGERAVFYTLGNNRAIIKDRTGHRIRLNKKALYRCQHLKTSKVKQYLARYNGLTIYHNVKRGYYTLEAFYKSNRRNDISNIAKSSIDRSIDKYIK